MNNVWFTVGSGRPHILFVAHSDELGWIVDKITPEGRVRSSRAAASSRRRSKPGPCSSTRAKGDRSPGSSRRDRATTSARRRERGAGNARSRPKASISISASPPKPRPGPSGSPRATPVTAKKTITDFAPGLMATRAVDDRAGCAALLDAALRLKPGDGQGPDDHLRLGRPGGDGPFRRRRAGQDPEAGLRLRHRHVRFDRLAARIEALRLPPRRQGGGHPGHRLEQRHAQDGDPQGPGHRQEAGDPDPGRQFARRQRRLGLPRRAAPSTSPSPGPAPTPTRSSRRSTAATSRPSRTSSWPSSRSGSDLAGTIHDNVGQGAHPRNGWPGASPRPPGGGRGSPRGDGWSRSRTGTPPDRTRSGISAMIPHEDIGS